MQLRWSEAAAADLERIADDLFTHTPERAPRIVKMLYEAPETLLTFPHRKLAADAVERHGTAAPHAAPHLADPRTRTDVSRLDKLLQSAGSP